MADGVIINEEPINFCNRKQKTHTYPLVQVHNNSISYSSRSLAATQHQNQCNDYQRYNGIGSSKSKLGLGVNAQTGRLQWCPGLTCCKILIVLPVIMLPITLVLVLLMRMDGMLLALQLRQQKKFQQKLNQEPIFLDDYDNLVDSDTLQDILDEELLITSERERLEELERIRRCISFKFGLSETIDVEDRDIMRDARTSFLPRDTTAIPRECLENLSNSDQFYAPEFFDINEFLQSYARKRLRRDRTSQSDTDSVTEVTNDSSLHEEDTPYIESMSSLQSFWNEQGTKESIREAQARTMLKYMDTEIEPCQDFYKYACGNWEKHHPIPKDKAGFDTFEMLRENLDVVLKELLEQRPHDEPRAHLKKITHIGGNNYEPDDDIEADIVKSVNSDLNDELKKQKVRRHIVGKRAILSRILLRYRRHNLRLATETTGTRRKRVETSIDSEASTSPQAGQVKTISHTIPHHKHHVPVKSGSHHKVYSSEKKTDAQAKARNLYQSCTNIKLLEKRGIQPLIELIHNLGGWPVLDANWNSQQFDWLNLTAQLRRYNNDILIVQWVGPDIKNSDENIIQFDQTNLGLPTREYYLQNVNAKYLHAYQRFTCDVMHKLGAPKVVALKAAADLIDFETRLASITAPAEKRLNVTKLYKRMTLSELRGIVPEIDWLRYLNILQDRNVNEQEQIVIYAIDYMKDLVNLLRETESMTIANYLMWRFIRHRINNVDDRFDDTKQTFYHALFGREESPSRWKVCISQVNTNMGMALGSMFVRKYFDENSKKDTLKMTHELQQAFREILKTTDWLDGNTKYLAELKVNAMSLKIGYPDFILNPDDLNEKYAGIEIDADKYFENTINVLLHTTKTEQSKLNEPVNKTTWQTAPAIVNAYYSRNKNQIMFPAGILQPPFYHRHFPRSLNFGGIGVVIGHELTHGFDDKGRLFDRNGSIHKWWSDSAIRGFDERARCIIAQYGNYTVGEVGIALNGESTQGENIADNGGIRQAFHAYKNWLDANPDAIGDERLPGLNMTGPQLFFLNFGQVWCGAMRPEAVRNKLNTAIHSPGRFRVIGTVSNSEDFSREFSCRVGSPMNPIHKCSVW
ncbi:glutamate receptor IID isoform 1-T1 [Glossina fuscipes fuscipes]